MGGSNSISALLRGVVPVNTLEALKNGELFIPYTVLTRQISQRKEPDGEFEVLSLRYQAENKLAIALRHKEYGEVTFYASLLICNTRLKQSTMDWQVE